MAAATATPTSASAATYNPAPPSPALLSARLLSHPKILISECEPFFPQET
jgi:hypothetical protein